MSDQQLMSSVHEVSGELQWLRWWYLQLQLSVVLLWEAHHHCSPCTLRLPSCTPVVSSAITWGAHYHTCRLTHCWLTCLQHWMAAAHKWATRLVMMSHGAMGGWQPVEGHARVLWKWHVAGWTGVPYIIIPWGGDLKCRATCVLVTYCV
jgi:hypothetical protein